jgi:hypothetical protein
VILRARGVDAHRPSIAGGRINSRQIAGSFLRIFCARFCAIGARGPQGLGFGMIRRQGDTRYGPAQVRNADVGIPPDGQDGRRMAGKLLGNLHALAALHNAGNVKMPEAMEIAHPARAIDHGQKIAPNPPPPTQQAGPVAV